MSLIATTIRTVERLPLPDTVSLAGIHFLVARTRARIATGIHDERAFARDMQNFAIAEYAADANAQHYELPAGFFALVLGPHRKYSSCLYPEGTRDLAGAEGAALAETAAHADLADGQRILELGCGWGSLSLWMAEHYPTSHITAVSNSRSQRAYIEGQARAKGFHNLSVITADMNTFRTENRFDRVVSVEMFEHMANWHELLQRIRGWLLPDGQLFIHVFSSRQAPYRFDHRDEADWIARNFFTGGIMPSRTLIRQFEDFFTVEEEWWWNGRHYERTARQWLRNFDDNRRAIDQILKDVYGEDAALWARRWRLFFLATIGLFGHADGTEWGVSHYRLKPAV